MGREGEASRSDEEKVKVNFMEDLWQGENRAGLVRTEILPNQTMFLVPSPPASPLRAAVKPFWDSQDLIQFQLP